MNKRLLTVAGLVLGFAFPISAQTNGSDKPTWWDKYQYLAKYGPDPAAGPTT